MNDGLQPIRRDSKDNGVAAMMVVLQKELMRYPSLEFDHQHGGDHVTCKPCHMTTRSTCHRI